MLEQHFLKPETLERIRGSWLGSAIERYVDWMDENGYSNKSVARRVPMLVQFGEFAKAAGAKGYDDLPAYAETFTKHWIAQHGQNAKTKSAIRSIAYEASNPIGQMLRLALQNSITKCKPQNDFKNACLKDFLKYLHEERGLSPRTIKLYRHCLKRLESFLAGIGVANLDQLSPPLISAFLTDACIAGRRGPQQGASSVLRILLQYLHREGILTRDLSGSVERTKKYKFSEPPRSISWEQVRLMLEAVDTRTVLGRRDFALLLLMVTYGLRAREVAALTLDDFDWKRNKFHVSERKAGHSTAYPLSTDVGSAIIDYLKNGRPETNDRHIFFRVSAPVEPMNFHSISMRARHYLKRAGIPVPRPGSHTLRHTCVQRLLDSHVGLKTIGDYVGHRSTDSTQVYAKVDIHKLRAVALGNGEDIV
ncbi:MAG: site-specific integrase [Candidatus Obscuribacterales bacterium]|nr:site-specific integrase [Candidatus Obscuribacterales bacterium]